MSWRTSNALAKTCGIRSLALGFSLAALLLLRSQVAAEEAAGENLPPQSVQTKSPEHNSPDGEPRGSAEPAPDKAPPAAVSADEPQDKSEDKKQDKSGDKPVDTSDKPVEKKDEAARPAVATIPGMPPVLDASNLYSEAVAGRLSASVVGALPRIYVPNVSSASVFVIDPATMKVVDHFNVGLHPQHIVPSWDLKTLWVTSNAERNPNGSVTPIDPMTGRPGRPIPVDDPYNMYFTADGSQAIVVAEAHERLDFRDPHTMELQYSLPTPQCPGINHADFSIDGKYALFTCEFGGGVVKVDVVNHAVLGFMKLSKGGMPQDIRVAPDGAVFYVADMQADGVFLIDGATLSEVGFIETGAGSHGLYPSRDTTKLYVSNRGSHHIHGGQRGPGSVSVIDFKTRRVEATWPIPGGGSPDMGNVDADGSHLWLSGRFDNVVYCIDTKTGAVTKIPVGREPHGLAVWPQPGRYSLGHTGIMR
jgi:YVTN family beta-propeller protein